MSLQTLSSSEASIEVPINENFIAQLVAGFYGKDATTCTALTWGHLGTLGASYNGNTVAAGTAALTDNATNYLVALRSTGAVSVSTGTTNWNNILYARLFKLTTVAGVVTAAVDSRLDTNGLFGNPQWVPVAVGDETTAITTGTAKVTFRWQGAFSLFAVRASLTTAQSAGSVLTIDVKLNGTSIFSTKITFDNTELTTLTAATSAVLTATPLAIADDDVITINIDQVGTSGAAGLKLYFRGAAG